MFDFIDVSDLQVITPDWIHDWNQLTNMSVEQFVLKFKGKLQCLMYNYHDPVVSLLLDNDVFRLNSGGGGTLKERSAQSHSLHRTHVEAPDEDKTAGTIYKAQAGIFSSHYE